MKNLKKYFFLITIYILLTFSSLSSFGELEKYCNRLVSDTPKDSAIRLYLNVNWISLFQYFFIFWGIFFLIFLIFITFVFLYPVILNKKIKNKILLHIILYYFSYTTMTSVILALCCLLNSDQISLLATLIAIITLFGFLFTKAFPFKLIEFLDSLFLKLKKLNSIESKLLFGSDDFNNTNRKTKDDDHKTNHSKNHPH